MSMQENFRTARQYIDLMLEGGISSEQLVRHYLGAIEQTDGELNAWVSVCEENAISQAQANDQLRKKGCPLAFCMESRSV